MPRLLHLATAGVLAAALATATACATVAPTGPGPGEPPPATGALTGPFDVVRVVDGDTYVIATDTGDVTVRHLGIDTPETVDPRLAGPECYGQQASQAAHDLLDGQQVWLEADPTQDTTDRYGRTLAHVWTGQTLVGQALATAGAAYEYTYDTPTTHHDDYAAAEQSARHARTGLWGACPDAT